jgi:hypothetical protein
MSKRKNKDGHRRTYEELQEARFRKEMVRLNRLRGGTYQAPPEPRRNDKCVCGSGKKYKRCCMKEEACHFLIVDEHSQEPWAPDNEVVVFPSMQSAHKRLLTLQHPARVAGIGVTKWAAFKERFNGEEGNPSYILYEDWKELHRKAQRSLLPNTRPVHGV